VDDDPAVLELLGKSLQLSDYEVDLCGDGPSGLERLSTMDYDLLIVDLKMPGMDGLSVIRETRRRNLELPVIIVTGFSTEANAIEAINLGVSGYLTKPFRREALCAMLGHWLPASAAAAVPEDAPKPRPATVDAGGALDTTALETIRALGGEQTPDLLEQIVRLYLEGAPELIASIRAGLAAADNDQVRLAAHSLKSSSANLGARNLAQMCAALEASARAGSIGTDAPKAEAIEHEYQAVCAALLTELGKST